MTSYCCSCRSATDRDSHIWVKIEVSALYNSAGFSGRKNRWKESKYICEECFGLFIEEFLERCEKDNEIPPEPSEADKSKPCDSCGAHQFKDDPHVRLKFYGIDGEIQARLPDRRVSTCYECFEREFSRFTIDTVEPLKEIPVFSPRQSKEYDDMVQSGVLASVKRWFQ